MEYFKITKRCIRCRKPLRADGTCQNPKCVRYKLEESETTTDGEKTAEDSTAGTSKESSK